MLKNSLWKIYGARGYSIGARVMENHSIFISEELRAIKVELGIQKTSKTDLKFFSFIINKLTKIPL